MRSTISFIIVDLPEPEPPLIPITKGFDLEFFIDINASVVYFVKHPQGH